MRKLCLLLLLLTAGCGEDNADVEMQIQRLGADLEAQRMESEALKQTIAGLRSEIRGLLDENQSLMSRMEDQDIRSGDKKVAQLERENADLKNQLAQYRSGLEKAVKELNRLGQKNALDQYISGLEVANARRAAQMAENRAQRLEDAAPASSSGECCVYIYDPYVSHADTSLQVSGSFENGRDSEISGRLIAEIYDGTEMRWSDEQTFTVPAKLRQDYSFDFRVAIFPQSGSPYQARVRWEDL